MKSITIAAAALAGSLVTAGCGGSAPDPTPTPTSSRALVTGAAAGCVRGNRDLCRLYFDLRMLEKLLGSIDLLPDIRLPPRVPCAADGPNCPFFADYSAILDRADGTLQGDPHPQPSKIVLPFEVLPADVQLEQMGQMRAQLQNVIGSLDQQIAEVQALAAQR